MKMIYKNAKPVLALALAVIMMFASSGGLVFAAGRTVNTGAAPSATNVGTAVVLPTSGAPGGTGSISINTAGTIVSGTTSYGRMPLSNTVGDVLHFIGTQVVRADGPYKVSTYVRMTAQSGNAGAGVMVRDNSNSASVAYAASYLRYSTDAPGGYNYQTHRRTSSGADSGSATNPFTMGATNPGLTPVSVDVDTNGVSTMTTPNASADKNDVAITYTPNIWIGLWVGRMTVEFTSSRILQKPGTAQESTLWQTESLATPTNGGFSFSENDVVLTWNAVTGANRYRVESPLGTLVGTSETATYTVGNSAGGATYYIIAENSTEGTIFPSDGKYLNKPPLAVEVESATGPYNLIYSANGGVGPVPATVQYDEDETVNVAFTPAPTKAGNNFLGWSFDPATTGAPAYAPGGTATFPMPRGSRTLNAMWERRVVFDANGGDVTPPERYVTVGTQIGALPASAGTKGLSQFGGWSASAAGDTPYTETTTVTAGDALTLYAIWNGPYAVSYNANGGAGVPAAADYAIGSTVDVAFAPAPAKAGNNFLGWSPAPAVNGAPAYSSGGTTSFTMGNAAVTLNAMWARQVNFDVNGGTGSAPSRFVAVGTVLGALPADPEPGDPSKKFGGWGTLPTGGTRYSAGTVVASGDALTLYALWAEPPTAQKEVLVRKDGSGDFTTIKEAYNFLRDNDLPNRTIDVGPGTFTEKLTIRFPVTISGAGRGTGDDATIITWTDGNRTPFRPDDTETERDKEYLYPSIRPGGPAGPEPNGSYGTMGSYSVGFFPGSEGSVIKNCAVTNTAGTNVGQTVALFFNADRCIADNIRLDAPSSDTFLVHDCRAYVVNSEIHGSTDFIFGNGQAVIYNSTINIKTTGGCMAAPSTDVRIPYGILIEKCTITGGGSSASLGRAWQWNQNAKEPAERYTVGGSALLKNNTVTATTTANGFTNGTGGGTPLSQRLREYGSVNAAGTLLTLNATRQALQLTQAQADDYNVFNVLGVNQYSTSSDTLYAEPWIPRYDTFTTPVTEIKNVSITSENGVKIGSVTTAPIGDTIKLRFDVTEKLFPMTKPIVNFRIGGREAAEAVSFYEEIAPNRYEATFKVNFSDHTTGSDTTYGTAEPERSVNHGGIDGAVEFTIQGIGLDGNDITPVSATSDGTSVVVDRTLRAIPDAPVVSPTADKADPYWDDEMYAYVEDTVMDNVPLFLEASGIPEFKITDAKYADLIRTANEGGTDRQDYTNVFKAAIADANAVGTGAKVIVPGGDNVVYYTGAIHLLSNVNLVVEQGATVRFLRIISQEYYPIVLQSFEGQELYNYSPPIYALKQKNIAVTGEGTLDAQYSGGWSTRTGDKMALNKDSDRAVPVVKRIYTDSAGPTAGQMPATIPVIDGDEVKYVALPAGAVNNRIGLRPCFIQPYACENIILRDVALRGTPMWNVAPVSCSNVLVDGLDINAVGIGNGDGVNPVSTQFVIIQNVSFATGDDCIAIKSFKNGDGLRRNEPSQYIIVRDCAFANGHGGVTCGSEISGGIRWVFAERCAFSSPSLGYALRFKVNSFRGATIENIYERNSTISRSSDAVLYIESSYTSGNNQDRVGDLGKYTPRLNNIYISDFTTPAGASIGCTNFVRMTAYTRAPINGVHIKNSTFRGVGASTVESLSGWELINVGTTTAANPSGTPTIVNSIPMKIANVKLSGGGVSADLKDTLTYGNNSVAIMKRSGTAYMVSGKLETASSTTPTIRVFTGRSKTSYATATVTPTASGYNFTANVTLAATENFYYINITAQNGTWAASNLNQTTAVHNVVMTDYAWPRDELPVQFTTESVTVDANAEAVYDNAIPVDVSKKRSAAATADAPDCTTTGVARAVWDGANMYILVEVTDASVRTAGTGVNTDGVEFYIDFDNDKLMKDPAGRKMHDNTENGVSSAWAEDYLIRVASNGTVSGTGPRGGTFNQRLVSSAARITPTGYNVELALALGGLPKVNGANFGFDIGINDMTSTQTARQHRVFWHRTDGADLVDVSTWGSAVLEGYNGTDPRKPDKYWISEYIKRIETTGTVPVNMYQFPRGKFPQGQIELDAAVAQAKAVIADSSATYLDTDAAAERLRNAILNLPNEGKFPNPKDLPTIGYMPNPFEFFDGSPVEAPSDWKARSAELKDLMSYYEFGDWPAPPQSLTATVGTAVVGESNRFNIPINITDNGRNATLDATITLPQGAGPFPVIVFLDFSGTYSGYNAYRDASVSQGFALMRIQYDTIASDTLNTRTGPFFTLYPWAEADAGSELTWAWGASRCADALDYIMANNAAYAGRFDMDKLVVAGFSRTGKAALLAGLYDERFKVVNPIASGSGGAGVYRYDAFNNNYSGIFTNPAALNAADCEILPEHINNFGNNANSMLWRFLDFDKNYKRDTPFGYGGRLPYDHHEIIAAIAPRAVIISSINDDHHNQPEGDATGYEGAKPVFEFLGVPQNIALDVHRAGGGHSVKQAQCENVVAFAKMVFFGTEMSATLRNHLYLNPYVATFDRYYGGLDAMMPWRHTFDGASFEDYMILDSSISGNVIASAKISAKKDANLVLAAFGERNELINVKVLPVAEGTGSYDLAFDFTSAAEVRAFFWDIDSYEPLCEPKKLH
ncbi:MAG: InlB B-repeat-containing protein [Oscillospiraceae bacterium]|jgi:polygalacturonase/pectin methylesterase-like acyl-CoA thioesterase|nr:InlB B-repeat-containing protein [Oscillospiraceae bacterium]